MGHFRQQHLVGAPLGGRSPSHKIRPGSKEGDDYSVPFGTGSHPFVNPPAPGSAGLQRC